MNFAGGIVYIYFKYIDIRQQPSPGSTYVEEKGSLDQNLRFSKSSANGHCVQDPAGSPAGTANMV